MRRLLRPAIAVVLLAAIFGVGVLVGSRGGDDATSPETAPQGALTLDLDGLPFTFEYPASFAPVESAKLPQGYWAILGISPVNFLDVRLVAEEELGDDAVAERVRQSLVDPSTLTDQTTVDAASTPALRFTVVDSTSGEEVTSLLHFLRVGGRTWEIGCQTNAAGSSTIRAACDEALATFAVRPS